VDYDVVLDPKALERFQPALHSTARVFLILEAFGNSVPSATLYCGNLKLGRVHRRQYFEILLNPGTYSFYTDRNYVTQVSVEATHDYYLGSVIRESTKQGNDKVARQMEAAHRTSLAKGEVGIREKKATPTLLEFCETRFEPWIESTTARKTWLDFYRVGTRAIKTYRPIASLRLDEVTSEKAMEFAGHRQAQGLQLSSVNSSLRALRRVLRIASEWGLSTLPKIKMLPGERHGAFFH